MPTSQNLLNPRSTALLVIDVQNDFCASSGVLARSGRDVTAIQRAVAQLSTLVEFCRKKKVPIVFTQLVYDLNKLPKTHTERMKLKKVKGLCAPRSKGTQFYKIQPEKGEKVIVKNYYSSFYKTELDEWLKKNKIETLV